jgi:heat-inducible transcriptional repressor
MKLTPRQIKLLGAIVDEYTYSAQPISSKEIIKKYMPNISSATIRNDMVVLEKLNLLEKTHTSSGRIPSINGYKYYEENILKPKLSINIQNRLKRVFAQRDISIDSVIDQSISIINESLKLPSVVISSQSDELLKRFDLIKIDDRTALVLLVTSSGSVNKTTLRLDNPIHLEDISTCVRIFNDRLIDTAIKDLNKKLSSVKEIIRTKVHEYEYCIQQVIEQIFNFNKINNRKRNVSGTK